MAALLPAGRRHYHDRIYKKEVEEEEWLQNPRWRTTNSDYGKHFVISQRAMSSAAITTTATATTSTATTENNNNNNNNNNAEAADIHKTRNPNLQDRINSRMSPGPSLANPNPNPNHNQQPHIPHQYITHTRYCDEYQNRDQLGIFSMGDSYKNRTRSYNSNCDIAGESATVHSHIGHGHVEEERELAGEEDIVDMIHGNVEPVDYIICSEDNTEPWKQDQHWNNVLCVDRHNYEVCVTSLPPWNPKPLKPKILFENIARKMEKERQMERERLLCLPLYKKMKSREWFQDRNPPRKQWQQSAPCLPMQHQENKKYDYYKYYGYGGQGAKTSWGHNLPLGQKPPFSKRIRSNK